ncbi:MAG: hypothetical protein RLZZ234_396 [Candidatus Parcubacteria bacterium]|jgi:hypothetical protein
MHTVTQAKSFFSAPHTCGVVHIGLMQAIPYNTEDFFRALAARKKVRYSMDLHEVLFRTIMVWPQKDAGMDVYVVACGEETPDLDMRLYISSRRYFTFDEAAEFLVAELGNSFEFSPKFSRTARNVLYLRDGTALNVWWHGDRKLWCIDRLRRGFGTWRKGDCFFGRFDAVELEPLAA